MDSSDDETASSGEEEEGGVHGGGTAAAGWAADEHAKSLALFGEDAHLDDFYHELEAKQSHTWSTCAPARAEQHPNMLPVTMPVRKAKLRPLDDSRVQSAPSFLAVSIQHGTAMTIGARDASRSRPAMRADGPRAAAHVGGRLWLVRPAVSKPVNEQPDALGARRVRARPRDAPPARASASGQAASSVGALVDIVVHAGRPSTRLPTSALLYGQSGLVGTRDAALVRPLSPRPHPAVQRLHRSGSASNPTRASALAFAAASHDAHCADAEGGGAHAHSAAQLAGASTRAAAARGARSAPGPPQRPRYSPASHKAFSANRTVERDAAIRVRQLLAKALAVDLSPEMAVALLDGEPYSPSRHARRPPPRAAGQFVRAPEIGRRHLHGGALGAHALDETGGCALALGLDGSHWPASNPSLDLDGSRDGLEVGVLGSSALREAGEGGARHTPRGALPLPVDRPPFVARVSNPRWLWEQRHAVARALARALRDPAPMGALETSSSPPSAHDGPRRPDSTAFLMLGTQHANATSPGTSPAPPEQMATPSRPPPPGQPASVRGSPRRRRKPRSVSKSPPLSPQAPHVHFELPSIVGEGVPSEAGACSASAEAIPTRTGVAVVLGAATAAAEGKVAGCEADAARPGGVGAPAPAMAPAAACVSAGGTGGHVPKPTDGRDAASRPAEVLIAQGAPGAASPCAAAAALAQRE
ncbi:hypothetical protein KFE25_006351 [Diacronema lutheri]|uniref:Uncharacterized protein n=1 Tax=Diacronema lutheri TaxID=2081491 RepID=A0A8J6CG96_DIALT|nr:hypothetical protein KFE25_006351 [Diacronema lutheri]